MFNGPNTKAYFLFTKSRMGVRDWQVAFFCLVDSGPSVLFSGSSIVSGLFSHGAREKEHVRNTFTLQNLSSEMIYFASTHVSLQRD